MAKKLLLVDDDALMRRSLSFNLEQAGYQVETQANAEDGVAYAQRDRPDLIVLDIGLPGMDGLEAVRIFRERLGIPVIFLTARRRELDEVLGLELGADDYVTKPFDLDVLLARIKAVLRRTKPGIETSPIQATRIGDLTIDPSEHSVELAGKPINLSPKEFELLYLLSQKPRQLVTTQEILTQVWGAEFIGEPQVIYVHVRWLREKIEKDPNHPRRIVTICSLGYKFIPQEV